MKIGLLTSFKLNLFDKKKKQNPMWVDLKEKFKSADMFLSTFNSGNKIENIDQCVRNISGGQLGAFYSKIKNYPDQYKSIQINTNL